MLYAKVYFLLLICEVGQPKIYNADDAFNYDGTNFKLCCFLIGALADIDCDIEDETDHVQTSCDSPIQVAQHQMNVPDVHKEDCAIRIKIQRWLLENKFISSVIGNSIVNAEDL